MNILERIRRGGDRAAGTEMPRQPEPWVEISESVSWLCSFDAVGGSISVKVIQDSRPIHDKMVDSFLEQIFSIRVATYPAQATAVSWILKDGMQHAGKLIYSSMGAKMDSEPKSWRILADVLYDLGTALEVISPLCPQLFLKWQTWETLRRETISTLFNVMGIGAGNGLASTLCSTTQRKEMENQDAASISKGGHICLTTVLFYGKKDTVLLVSDRITYHSSDGAGCRCDISEHSTPCHL